MVTRTENWAEALHVKACNNFNEIEWCCERGLNSRPLPYQGSALPLSYRSLPSAADFWHITIASARRLCSFWVAMTRAGHNDAVRSRHGTPRQNSG